MSDSALAWVIRPAEPSDAPRVAQIHREALGTALPLLPTLHSPEQDVTFFSSAIARQHVAVATCTSDADNRIDGFVAWSSGWVDHLYISPQFQRRGIGSMLLDLAKRWHAEASKKNSVELWTFQRNTVARRFYHRHGFVPVEFTDGSGNEEKEPDIRLRWSIRIKL